MLIAESTLKLPYAQEEGNRIIQEYYPNTSTKILALILGLSETQVFYRALSRGIKKSKEYHDELRRIEVERLREAGKSCQFKKGHSPANKGKQMSIEQYEKCRSTMFKKGHIPVNTKYDGHLSIRMDRRTGKSYIYIRIRQGKYRELHRVLWEKHYGSIPKGYNVVFKDGKQVNVFIENLELVTNEELMRRNTIHNYPEDLKELIRALAKLNKTIKNYGEEYNG